ncbi:MAG: N-acetylmuramoyl-L-alanine amidase [Tepidanaerobacteraceae bacterium]|nr:N-acetylmuramoyl-L-alanine amidase [Tepidanaerobacteraceae bacterium]
MIIKWTPSPNFTVGRKGKKIIAIVDHITAGFMPGCLNWLCNPKAQASAHYLVTRDGRIFQLVKDENTAWHAGMVNRPYWQLYDGTNPNYYTIGIEHEGFPNKDLTEAQYQASLSLHRLLIQRYDIPIDNEHIVGHYRIDSVRKANCPGPKFPWDRLFNDLRKGDEENVVRIKILFEGKELDGFIKDGKAYVEVRKLCEALGLKVYWNDKKKQVEVSK